MTTAEIKGWLGFCLVGAVILLCIATALSDMAKSKWQARITAWILGLVLLPAAAAWVWFLIAKLDELG